MYSTSSLKQQSTYWHVAPLRHIILTPSQLVFELTPSYCLVSREATYTNLIVIELTIDQTEDLPHLKWNTNYHSTEAVFNLWTLRQR